MFGRKKQPRTTITQLQTVEWARPYVPPRNQRGEVTTENVRKILSKITYKPERAIYATRNWFTGGVDLIVGGIVEDSVQANGRAIVSGQKSLPLPMSMSDFLAFVRREIHSLEIHEADEWLKLDGTCIHDPHKSEFTGIEDVSPE